MNGETEKRIYEMHGLVKEMHGRVTEHIANKSIHHDPTECAAAKGVGERLDRFETRENASTWQRIATEGIRMLATVAAALGIGHVVK